ncbi:MAG: hypothetical protein ACMG6E_01250 [Candidatus Roizmanbacteria bacterium]
MLIERINASRLATTIAKIALTAFAINVVLGETLGTLESFTPSTIMPIGLFAMIATLTG